MAQTQRFPDPEGTSTWTVVDATGLPVDWVEEYLDGLRLRANAVSPNTVKSYARGLALFASFLDECDLDWHAVDLDSFDEFVAWLRATFPSQREDTYVTRVNAVASAYKWHWMARGVTFDETLMRRLALPTKGTGGYRGMLHHIANDRTTGTLGIRRGFRNPHTPVLEPAQVRALLTFFGRNVRDHLLFSALAETGARVGEMLNTRHKDWRTTGGGAPFIMIEPQGNAHPRAVRGKQQNFRQVYISTDLALAYDNYVWSLLDLGLTDHVSDVENHYTFVNLSAPKFRPTGYDNVRSAVSSLKEQCPDMIPSTFTAHWLRHTHAAALLLSGAELHVVSHRLGHADIQTTMKYYGWVSSDASLRALSGWQSYVGGWAA